MKTKSIFLSLFAACFVHAQTALCTSNLGGGTDPQFIEISISGTAFNHLTYAALSSYYHVYPASGQTTADLTAGQNYSLYASTSSEAISALWLDYNNNGIFEASEYVLLANSMNTQNSSSFQIPLTAAAGPVKMRIRSRAYGSALTASDACSSFGSGETRDYTVNIVSNSLSTADWSKEVSSEYYPNPVKDQFTIQGHDQIESLTVSDFSGRKIFEKEIKSKKKTVDLGNLKPGNYIITLFMKNRSENIKIVKE
nr:GEVED domain-containing protein [uncultured Chryseobacterium sp.]